MSDYVDVAAIRARLAAATPGRRHLDSRGQLVTEDPDPDVNLSLWAAVKAAADADLIAHAPADLAALCDEVDVLHAALAAKDAENERLRGFVDAVDAAWIALHEAPDSAWGAANDRLRADLATAIDDRWLAEYNARAALADGEATG